MARGWRYTPKTCPDIREMPGGLEEINKIKNEKKTMDIMKKIRK